MNVRAVHALVLRNSMLSRYQIVCNLLLRDSKHGQIAAKGKQEGKPIMRKLLSLMAALGAFATFAVVSADRSLALTAKECSTKYKAAKTAGTLNGETWNEFRKKECAGAEPAATATPEAKTEAKPAPAATVAPSGAVFPKSIDPKYATKSAGKGRFYTCLDQYKANKGTNGNGGLKWIQKGGGYYSLCNNALKG